MTSQKDKIQSLITDIEQVLSTQRPKKPWVRASDMEPQRQALAKAQDYLRSLQQSFDAADGWGPVDPTTGRLIAPEITASAESNRSRQANEAETGPNSGQGIFSGQPQPASDDPDDVLRSLLTEMKFLKSSALEPLRLEMDRLRLERDGLQQEVKGLEAQRSALIATASAATGQASVSDEQLNQFLAVLMDRLQERLSVQVTQTLGQLETDYADTIAKLTEATETEVLQLKPAGQSIEEMRQLQSRSDQLLVNIESTLQSMYETLQKNIDSYQISLNEGIENMHSLGRQGEVIVRSLVDHLTQQLGQTAPPEPAFFPARSAESSYAYAIAEASATDTPTSETVPTRDAIASAISDENDASIAPDDAEGPEDIVSSLDEILPDEISPDEAEASYEISNEDGVRLDNSAPDIDSDALDVDSADSANLNIAGLTTAVEPSEPVATPSEIAEATGQSSDLSPEDCIREDGTIDLDLLKLDIDRDEETDALSEEDMMIDAAIADAQVAAQEAEDPEIEAKVTPTADAAYLADLTLDDLTSVDNILSESSFDDLLDGEIESAVNGGNLETTLSDVNRGEPLFLETPLETPLEAPPESISESTDETASAEEPEETDRTEVKQEDAQVESESRSPAVDPEMLAAAALGAAAATQAVPSAVSESPEEWDFWDAPSSIPDSAKVPDIPDAQDDRPADSADATAIEINDTVSDEMAAELEADNLRADQIAASAVRRGLEAVSALIPDLEEPTVSEEDMPAPERLSAEAEPLESSKIPDRPEDATEESTSEESTSEESILEEGMSEEGALEDTPPEPSASEQPSETSADILEGELVSDASTDAERGADAQAELASDLSPTDLTLPTVAAAAIATTASDSTETPQFVDEDPFGETFADLEFSAESIEETTVAEEVDAGASADNIDFFETSDEASKAADDIIEKLSTESLEDDVVVDATGHELENIAPIEEIEGLPEFPELPAIAPPLADIASPDPTLLDSSDLSSQTEAALLRESEFSESELVEPELGEIDSREADGMEDSRGAAIAGIAAFSDYDDDEGDDEDGDDEDDIADDQPTSWFLGIDLGTTGLSAVLINRLGDQVYPLYWPTEQGDRTNEETSAEEEQYGLFRLPVVLSMDNSSEINQVSAIGLAAIDKPSLRIVKPLLKVGLPQENPNSPLIQWSDSGMVPLLAIESALAQVLSTLSAQQLGCKAINLKKSALRRILSNLDGVAVGYPNNWPDTYSFNIREAVISAGIVESPDQVFFVEEAIAALLSALPDPQVELDEAESRQPSLYNCNWQGGTVIISAGATLTEAGVVDLPAELDQLIYRDFALRSFTYAGDNLDQDIICQLLHIPLKQASSDDSATQEWNTLGLDTLQIPVAGEADRIKRHRLRQRLNSSALGREVIAAARELKMVLQEETQCELTLAGQSWVVKRKDLETKVFIPYIQRVNRLINSLLNQKGLSAQSVKQVICTGGSAAIGAIARWLRQKFPNATIIQDTYSGEYSNSCSRVAYGLANLCNYPYVLDAHRHQYNDYFLLLELLRVLPDQPLPAGGILHLLEQRGVNIQACQSHILALIEGHLPPGLVPTEGDRPLISAQSPNIETYRILSELPLFRKQGGQIYIADEAQGERLRQHLESLLASKHQKLNEPMAVGLIRENV